MRQDWELLREYAEERSEAAFSELVHRHIDLVYAAALRVVSGDTHLAQDVTQIVFATLACRAGTLRRHVVLVGWLYRTACFTAVKAIRAERRRQIRERKVMEMADANAGTEPGWDQITGQLDEALNHLSAADRDAIVLRFLKQQDFRSVAAAMRVSEDAAQKRVSRALEKLRAIVGRQSPSQAKLTVAALASVLTAQAATAAPAGLAISTTAASLAGAAAIGNGIGLLALKLMSMSKLQLGMAGTLVLASVATPVALQTRSVNQLRQENVALRQQVEQLAQPPAIPPAPDYEMPPELSQQIETERAELLALRNEVRQLREEILMPRSATQPKTRNQTAQNAPPADPNTVQNAMRELGLAASRGDFTALDKLAEVTAVALKGRTNAHQDVCKDIRIAFDVMASEAGSGNETAFQALWRGTRNKFTDGLSIQALGKAAGMGNEKALEMLLDPEKYLLLESSTVSALGPAARNGDVRAVHALAQVTRDPKKKPLWYMAASGLRNAAIAGNETAIDAMAAVAKSETSWVRKEALLALENAAFNQHPKAIEALRALGYQ